MLQHRTDGTDAFDVLYIDCTNESRVEFIPTMPSAAKLWQFIANFPHREIMPYISRGVLLSKKGFSILLIFVVKLQK